MQKSRLLYAALLASALLFSTRAHAQVLADRVPSDAIVYAGWAGSDTLGPAYEASNLKKILEAFDVPRLLGDQLQKGFARQPDPQAAQFGNDLLSALSKYPSAIYVGPVDTTGQDPAPRIAFFAKVGKPLAADLAARANDDMKKNPNNDIKAEAVAAGDFLLIQSKNIDIRERLAGAAPPEGLATQETFRKTLTHLGPDAAKSALIAYADGQAITDTLNDLAKKTPDPQNLFPALLAGSGIASLRQIIWAGNFDGANWSSSGFVGMRDRRNGLLALLDHKPLSEASLKLIPKSATEAAAFRFDGTRLLKELTDAAALRDENTAKQLDTALNELYKVTGIEIKRDLFPAFSGGIL